MMKKTKWIISFSTTILLILPVFALAAEKQSRTASATAKGASSAVLFQKYCSICHGDNGNGKTRVVKSMDPRPRDFTQPDAAEELTRERMINSITHGRPGTAMVSHKRKLSAEEIESIVDYIRLTFMAKPGSAKQPADTSLASSSLTGSGQADASKSTPLVLSAQAKLGKTLFKKNCSSCHGDKGNTAVWARSGLNPPPRDFTSEQAKSELTRDRMVNSVTNGRPGTAMMPFTSRLSEPEIQAVVTFIRSAFMQIDDGNQLKQPIAKEESVTQSTTSIATLPDMTEHATIDMNSPMPSGLQADMAQGKDFYMNNCYVCHGKKGDGKGPRSHFITPRPRNFTSETSRKIYNRPRLFDAIEKGKRGTVMPAWGKVLNDQQIANVTEFVFQEFIQTEAKSSDSAKKEKTSLLEPVVTPILISDSDKKDKKKANVLTASQLK